MKAFKPRSSGVGSEHSVNCATTTPPLPEKNISLPYSSINLNYFKIRRYVKPKAKQEMFAIEHIAIVERKRERGAALTTHSATANRSKIERK